MKPFSLEFSHNFGNINLEVEIENRGPSAINLENIDGAANRDIKDLEAAEIINFPPPEDYKQQINHVFEVVSKNSKVIDTIIKKLKDLE